MSEDVVTNPTYFQHIRGMFDNIDLEHMASLGIDISTPTKLKERANDVYFQTKPPNANMPPNQARKWSQERSDTFLNWIRNGHPLGQPQLQKPKTGDVERVRRNTEDVAANSSELEKLKKAFHGMMNKDPDDPDSYFAVAGQHWYPSPQHCKHHEDRYNPWHRAYLIRFEDALRTVPGCEDVTLPYWDIMQRPPDFLFQPPFDSYTLPKQIHTSFPAGYVTQRFDAASIVANVNNSTEPIPDTIRHAMGQPIWSDFVSYTARGIEAAHDAGHGACGDTLSTPDAASFDPLFWFFHSNWDRLWWEWQQAMGATTLWKFRSTITGGTEFLEAPLNELKPFALTADQTIDLHSLGVTYELPATGGTLESLSVVPNNSLFGHFEAASGFRIASPQQASVRLKGINRLVIPGSFRANLMADGEKVASRTFFQSRQPMICDNCRKRGTINLDFLVDSSAIEDRELKAQIELLSSGVGMPTIFPLRACGNPTINIRMLLHEK